MVSKLKYHISVAAYLMKLSIRKQFEWIMMYISFMVAFPVKCATGLILIYVLVNRFSPLYGWSFNQLIFLYGLAYLSEGLASAFTSQAWRLDVYITRGEFDRNLVRPLNVLFQFLFRSVYLMGFLDMLSGLIIFIYGCGLVGFTASVSSVGKVVLVVLGGAFIRISAMIMVGAIAFWTKRSWLMVVVTDEVLRRTTQYPLSIYPLILQALFTFILPFGFVSFYPSSDFLGFSGHFDLPLNLAILTPCIGIIMFIICNKVFNLGLKIYESAGA